ncbi:MAG: hypothetical protein CL910_04060 [Deltaproteobacteria bacterium]|jgi:photosystem II stability/assembly factor-like uncharacterized protein|nr:hypothetical protein [Deltaproteobacteria bacterium]
MLSRRPLSLLAAILLCTVACHEVHFEPRSGVGEIDILDDLFAVSAVDENLVLASGYWGAIYRSEDGGQSWLKSDTGVKSLIYDVSMADQYYGWAVGQLGLVLRTEDGGKTWAKQSTPKDDQGVHLFSVQSVGPQEAIAVGEWGTIIVTRDGGKTWRDDSLTVDETHPQFVWLSIFDQERVRKGEPVFEDVGLNDVSCLSSNTQHCWVIGEFAYLFRSENGGENWERGEILSGIKVDPIQLDYNSIEITDADRELIGEFSRQIADQQHLNIAIEPRVSAREIANFGKESDPFPLFEIVEARVQEVQSAIEAAGILSDRIRRRGAPPWDYEDFLAEDPEFLSRYFEGRKRDSPQIEVNIAQNPYLFAVRFADENDGYISGLGGVVLRSRDGGRTWRYEDIGRKMAVFSVEPLTPDRAVIVGEKGLLRITTDSGKTWEESNDTIFDTIFTFMRDVDFVGNTGYVVGQRGMILRSDDGGSSWRAVTPTKSLNLADAH